MKDSPISSTVDFEKNGVQHGFLKLPHSHDQSAWGSIIIPISVVKNGKGPTILFTRGLRNFKKTCLRNSSVYNFEKNISNDVSFFKRN